MNLFQRLKARVAPATAEPQKSLAADASAPQDQNTVDAPNEAKAQEEGKVQNGADEGLNEKSNGESKDGVAAPGAQNGTAEKDANNSAAAQGQAASESDEDPDKDPMSGIPLYTLSLGLCMATFVVALDNTIIATAIPRITTQFNSLDDVGWYGSSYLLTTTSLQPSFGKVYTYFDIKWTYLSALCIFELGSIICAAAQSSLMLIIGRAVAGAGAAALFSGGLNIIGYAVSLRKRAIYIALLSSMFGISSIVGPILGGVFTDKVSWRWCFWINLPFGAVALLTVFIFFKNPERPHTDMTVKQKLREIDMVGAFFLICAIVCLLLALQWGGSTYPWSDSRVWGCLLGFGLIITVFFFLQVRRGDRATIPPRILIKQRTIFASAIFMALLSMGLYTHIYYLPFYFQAVKGTTAEQSGIRIVAYLVSNTIASVVVGALITVIGFYTPFLWVGSIIFAIGCGLIYTLQVDSGPAKWVGYQILAGIGAGVCVQIPFTATQVVLSVEDMPSGNAIAIFFNTLGGAISISIAQNIFTNVLLHELPKDAPGVNAGLIVSAGATHVRDVTTPQQLPGVLQAYDKAVTSAFIVPIATSALSFFFTLMVEWRSVKEKKKAAAASA